MKTNDLPRAISSITFLLIIVGAVLLLIPGTVGAQEEDEYILEDIVVTATKTGETNLQETALTMSVFDDQSISNLSSFHLEDLSQFMLNTKIFSGGDGPMAYLRGIGTNVAIFTGDQNVGFYLDGVYLHQGISAMIDFLDVERVEVLRGPQGTLWGRNATGGTINIITKDPSAEFELLGSVDIGNYAYRRVDAMISGPLLEDKVRVRFAASDSMHDGYVDNLGGRDLKDDNYHAFRGSIQLLGERWDLVIKGDYRESQTGMQMTQKLIGYSETGMSGYLAPFHGIDPDTLVPEDFYTMHTNQDSSIYLEFWGLSAHLDVKLRDDMHLRSITSYREHEGDRVFDYDGSQISTNGGFENKFYEEVSQELQLTDEFEGSWGHLQWLVGGYYYEMTNISEGFVFGSVSTQIGLVEWDPLSGAPPPFDVFGAYSIQTTAYAGFGSFTLTFPNDLALTGGIRYSKEDKVSPNLIEIWPLGIPLMSFGWPAVGLMINEPAFEGEWSAWTPKIGLEYNGIEDIFLYATYSEGFKSGMIAPGNMMVNFMLGTNLDPLMGPESLTAYEVGMKSDWLDKKLRINTSAFYYDYTDLQVMLWLAGFPYGANAAEAEIYGAEVEMLARPIPALTLNGSLAYLNSEYTEYITTDPVTETPSDASGNQLVHAPEWNLILGANYVVTVEDYGFITFGANAVWQDDTFADATNDPWSKIDDYWIVNALVRYETQDAHWSMELWAKNLFETEYYDSLTADHEDRRGMIGDPMTMGFKVVYHY